MDGYTLDVIQKLGADFYDKHEDWLIDPTSDFWKKVEYGENYDYSPAALANIIKNEKEEKEESESSD